MAGSSPGYRPSCQASPAIDAATAIANNQPAAGAGTRGPRLSGIQRNSQPVRNASTTTSLILKLVAPMDAAINSPNGAIAAVRRSP